MKIEKENKAMFCARGICMSYGRHTILEKCGYRPVTGRMCGDRGANGCGKTNAFVHPCRSREMQKEHLCRWKDIFKEHSYCLCPSENPTGGRESVKGQSSLWYIGQEKWKRDLVDGPAVLQWPFSVYPAVFLAAFFYCWWITGNHLALGGFCRRYFARGDTVGIFALDAFQRGWKLLKGIVTENVEGKVIGQLLILFAVGFTVSWLKEVQEK